MSKLTTRSICPGQDTRYWKPGDVFEVPCANCGSPMEFFKDEARRRCGRCGRVIVNPKLSAGCAQWCEHAKACLGFDPKDQQADSGVGPSLVACLIEAVKREFGDDQKRIDHALAVLNHARELLAGEPGEPRVVLAAALLHDIGIREAERKYGSANAVHQEREGPPIAARILKNLDLDPQAIDHVCRIIGSHHSGRGIDTPEFRILWDADWLVNLPDVYPDATAADLAKHIDRLFKTETGKKKARRMVLSDAP